MMRWKESSRRKAELCQVMTRRLETPKAGRWPISKRILRSDCGLRRKQKSISRLGPPRAAFGGVVELDGVRVHRDVLAVQRRESESAVILGVLFAPDPKDADVEQADRARQHVLSGWFRIPQL